VNFSEKFGIKHEPKTGPVELAAIKTMRGSWMFDYPTASHPDKRHH
jgi:hypothetical protein